MKNNVMYIMEFSLITYFMEMVAIPGKMAGNMTEYGTKEKCREWVLFTGLMDQAMKESIKMI